MLFDRVNCKHLFGSTVLLQRGLRRRFFGISRSIPSQWSMSDSAIIVIGFDDKNGQHTQREREKMQMKRRPNGIEWLTTHTQNGRKKSWGNMFLLPIRWHASQQRCTPQSTCDDVAIADRPTSTTESVLHFPPMTWAKRFFCPHFFLRCKCLFGASEIHRDFFFLARFVRTLRRCIIIISVKCSHRTPMGLWNNTIVCKNTFRLHCSRNGVRGFTRFFFSWHLEERFIKTMHPVSCNMHHILTALGVFCSVNSGIASGFFASDLFFWLQCNKTANNIIQCVIKSDSREIAKVTTHTAK